MNVSGQIAGHTETPLTDEGRAQAKRAGKAAKGLGIDLILASPLSRTIETAQLVAEQIGYDTSKIQTSTLLIERFFGSLEGELYDPKVGYSQVKNIEKDKDLVERAYLALEWINSFKANHILVVSHGSFGRALRSILKSEYPMSHPERINNAEILCWIED